MPLLRRPLPVSIPQAGRLWVTGAASTAKGPPWPRPQRLTANHTAARVRAEAAALGSRR